MPKAYKRAPSDGGEVKIYPDNRHEIFNYDKAGKLIKRENNKGEFTVLRHILMK